MLSVLLLSLLFFIQDTFARQPTCPNGQQPKVDKTGNIVQCLPGSPQNAICGMDHTCFFSGLNYMCCPSNEPSPENQPSCANPMLTVLDSHGLPLKCSPRTRLCPQTSMFCSDVGLAFICCEAIPTIVSGTKTSTMVTKTSILKKIKKTRTALLPEETLDCPAKSIGLLHQDGSRIICNSRKKCPGKNTFCHGPYKRSICCERYEYAGSILDNKEAPRATPSVPGSSFIKNQNHLRSNNISVSLKRPGGTMKKVDRTTLEIDNIVDSAGWIHSNEMINLNKINKINSAESQPRPQRPESLPNLVIQAEGNSLSTNIKPSSKDSTLTIIKEEHLIKNGSKTPLLPSAKQLETTTTTKTTTTTTTTTATTPPTTTTTTTTTTMTTAKITMEASNVRSKAQGTRINDLSTDIFSPNELSKTPPSELFTSQDKRSMAQQFLVYQIRNGWPYDDRFYRSDIDAFTPEQRRDMTHLHFFDN